MAKNLRSPLHGSSAEILWPVHSCGSYGLTSRLCIACSLAETIRQPFNGHQSVHQSTGALTDPVQYSGQRFSVLRLDWVAVNGAQDSTPHSLAAMNYVRRKTCVEYWPVPQERIKNGSQDRVLTVLSFPGYFLHWPGR